jgi:hypothetical protein
MNRFLLTVLLAFVTVWALPAHAASSYEESLKQLAEGVIADAVKAKRGRLAVLDFTDSKGTVTPIGQFLAEELSTQILVAGEIKVIDRALVDSTLKKFHVTQFEQAQAHAVTKAAKAVQADVFAAGSYLESADGVRARQRRAQDRHRGGGRAALRHDKFRRRFRHVEQAAAARGVALRECSFEELDALWDAAKAAERQEATA